MASASTFIRKSFKYDVFLSFRGEDTRTNFVDHLYYALQHKGIHTYKDDERIKKGKKINDELIRSIEDSKFYIIVFSKNYSSSSWCLNELVKIMECNNTGEHTAYPVFYDVGPSEVRKQSGTVEKSIANHENEEVDGKWREALREAADLAGWELKNTADSHEAKFIQKIVEELSLELRAINFNIDDKLVGMETRINDILASLGNDFDDVRMIGIKGMGGGGKTTLARAVFDQISFQFECRSFVENVREVSKASLFGLKTLQKKILFDVFREKDISIDSVYDGINMMRRRMPGIKVLLVLDDVDHIEQLEALAGEMKWFKPGSRIVITTRDEQVLVAHGVNSIHNVQLLLDEEAIRLFSRYAFGRVIPNTGYEELSRQVIRYAAGLPLTIRVLGSFLCGKSDLEWIDALERLKTIPLMETLKKLELSYISLEDDYKEIFLNVACILKGSSIAFAIKALESCKFHARNGLRVLEQKSLISIDRGHLGMHDHVEEMGMNIVRRSHPDNPEKQSRLWIYEELEDILTNDMGTKATRYIRLHMGKLSPEVVMKGLRKMTGLRFLDVEFFGASKSDCSRGNQKLYKFPNSLRYLRWTHYCFSSLPKTFQANNIVALEMPHSRIVQLWEVGGKKVLNKLRFLDLSYSMVKSLDLGLTPNIETLNLEGCCELVELHMFAECTKLIIVNLKSSTLRTLNLGSTTNIEQLDLERCLDLVELHMPGEYPNLRSLNLSNLKLRILGIGSTPNLEYLDLEYCFHLEQFHMADECHKLTSLIISHSKLKYLDLGLTPSLKTLNLQNCYNLVEIHVAYECLKNLIYLDLSGCLRFTSFTFHIWIDTSCSENKSFPLAELHLVAMSLDGCPVHPNNSLPKFQFQYYYKEDKPLLTRNLEKLLSVGLCACTNLDTFSRSICGLQYLRKLKLEGGILEPPRELNLLECLEELDFSYTKVKDLPDSICMLKHLESLKINHCWYLEKLPDYLGRLECLKKVTLKCAKIKSLPDSICMLKHLESLKLYWCSSLEMLPEDLGRLECLKKLTIRSAKIKDLPGSICMLKHLESLELDGCWNLEKLPGDLGRLLCLKKLNLSFCKLLRDIPDSICNMKYLKYLNLWYCAQLEKLPEELGCLECLEILDITYTSISHLPQSIYLLKGLRIFGWLRNNKSFHVGYTVGN